MSGEAGVQSGSGPRRPIPVERLAPREREVAEAVFERGEATAAELCRQLDGVGNSALRSMLRRLEKKRVLRHRREGNRFVYMPARAPDEVRMAVLRRIAMDYFDGSVERLAIEARGLCDEARG